MEMVVALLLVGGALLAIVAEHKTALQKMAFVAMAIALLLWMLPGFGENDPSGKIVFMLAGMVVAGGALAWIPTKAAVWLAGLITLTMLLLSGEKATYFDFELTFSGTIIWLPLLGAVGPLILPWKAQLLHKWTGVDSEKTLTSALAFYGALLAFFAVFQAGFFGLTLVAFGWLTVALADRTHRMEAGAFGLLSLAFVVFLFKTNPHVEAALLRGNFLMGLIAGAAASAWMLAVYGANKLRWPLLYIVPLLIITALVLMGLANENFGGIPAYAGALTGASLLLITRSEFRPAIAFQGLLLALAVPVIAQFQPVSLPKKTSRLEKQAPTAASTTPPSVMDVKAIPLDAAMAGTWHSVTEASKVDFELGPPEARTKGAIGAFDVTLQLAADGQPGELRVDIPTAKVTTLNPMRDETVLGPGYLDAKKYPKTRFTARSIQPDGDAFKATGTFEFLGKKQPLTVELKFAASGSEKGTTYLVMVGKARFDRTQFGMASDPKIGNVVDVVFELEFRK